MNSAFAQKLEIDNIQNLKTTHPTNQIYDLKSINNDGLLIADTRLENGYLNALLVHFNLKGEILKEITLGKTDSYERVVSLAETETGYYLLLNSVKRGGQRTLLFYTLDKALSILSSEEIVIPNIQTANSMVYHPKRNTLMITISIEKGNDNFPQLVIYDLATQSIVATLDFNKKNRPEDEKVSNFPITIIKTDKNGKRVKVKTTEKELAKHNIKPTKKGINKECMSIQFAGENYDELLLTGLENSTNITDFWVAKVVNNQIIWEDKYPTKIGGDKGKAIFKTKLGYINFGHEYTKNRNVYYSYRILLLDENGKEIGAKQFDKSQKDWFKDVVQLSEETFLMFGQEQTVTLPKSMLGEEIVNTSNLWAIVVNAKGEMIIDFLHETDEIEEAHAATRLDNGDILILYSNDKNLKTAQLKLLAP
jgi:hypothetical protein